MAELSVLRALNEVSLLNKKIDRALSRGGAFVAYTVGNKPQGGFKTVAEVENDIKSRYQSATDLIKRRSAIKAAIVASNAVTNVTIAGDDMTVAAAIELKGSIEYDKALLQNLRTSFVQNTRSVERHNENMEAQLERMISDMVGGKNSKVNKDEYAALADPFRKDREAVAVDPIDIKTVMENMETRIEEFERTVDNILTESNATTIIVVPDN